MGGEDDEGGGNGQRLSGKSGIGEGREGIGDLRIEVRIIWGMDMGKELGE